MNQNQNDRFGCLRSFEIMFGGAVGWFAALTVIGVILAVALLVGCCIVTVMIGGVAGA